MAKILVVFMISILSFLSGTARSEEKLAAASCIDLPHSDGNIKNICDRNGQKNLMIEFFSPGCPACHRNVPQFKKLEEETKNFAYSKLISLKNQQQTASFIARYNINTEVVFDSSSEAYDLYSVRGVPTTIVINQYNQIIYRFSGFLSDGEIGKIRKLVE